MKLFILIRIIGFLKYGHIVCAALVKISIFVCIYRIDFQSYHTKIFPRKLTRLSNIRYVTLTAAFSCKDQNLLHTAVCNDLHFFFNLLHGKLHAADMVIAVKSTVHTVIFAVICNIQRRKEIHGVSEMPSCLHAGPLGHFLKKRLCRRRKQSFKILHGAGFMIQRSPYIRSCVSRIVIAFHLIHNVTAHLRFNLFHPGQIFHMIFPKGRICLQTVLFFQSFFRKILRIYKKLIFHFTHL